MAQPAALPGEEARVATAIAEAINAWAVPAGQDRTHWSTSELTAELTEQASQALIRHDPSGRVRPEALIPLTRPGAVKHEAVDMVACRTDRPDIVVELDSRPWSARELAYARQAGAIRARWWWTHVHDPGPDLRPSPACLGRTRGGRGWRRTDELVQFVNRGGGGSCARVVASACTHAE